MARGTVSATLSLKPVLMTGKPLPLDEVTVKTPFFRGPSAPSLSLDEAGFVESVVYVLRCRPQIVGGPFTWYVGRAPRCKLGRSDVDASLWTVVEDLEGGRSASRLKPLGYILTYVGDYFYTAEEGLMKDIESLVQSIWTCSLQPIVKYVSSGSLNTSG